MVTATSTSSPILLCLLLTTPATEENETIGKGNNNATSKASATTVTSQCGRHKAWYWSKEDKACYKILETEMVRPPFYDKHKTHAWFGVTFINPQM